MFSYGSFTIRDILKVYLMTLLIGCMMNCAQAIFDLFIQALFNHYFNKYAARFIEPITSFLIGGPTFNAINAIYRVTPILNPSILGQRIDTMIQIAGSSAVTSLTVAISNMIENSIRTCIDISIGVGIAASNAISNLIGGAIGRSLRIDYIRSENKPKNIFSRDVKKENEKWEISIRSKTKTRASKSNMEMRKEPNLKITKVDSALRNETDFSIFRNRNIERIHPGREKAPSSPYDVTIELLERNPLLERFLEAVDLDKDDCLKKIICSINASAEDNLTKEEIKFKIDFRTVVKKYQVSFPSLTSFVTASNTGQNEKTQKACRTTYPKCTYPLIARALFIYLARFTSH